MKTAMNFKTSPFFRLFSLLMMISLLTLSGFINATINGSDFTFQEATIKDIHRAFTENKLTSTQLVDFYLYQIETLNPLLRSVVQVNPDARDQAAEADREWRRRSCNGDCSRSSSSPSLGTLHGIPVLLKDSIASKDKPNTTAAGSYAPSRSEVPRDAHVVEMLRKAGAVIMGKASMDEWYQFRSFLLKPDGWCLRSGQAVNPYVQMGSPCGSTSGSAISVAANMVAISLGTETDESILCPADHNSVVGIKPTVGLTSRAGLIPLLPHQDSIGPICRTVSDAVYVLDAIVGFDPRDYEATKQAAKFIPVGGYKQFLNEDGLHGKRLGVVRSPFSDLFNGSTVISALEQHVNTLRQRGATIVDNLEIADIDVIQNPFINGKTMAMLGKYKLCMNQLKELINSPRVKSLAHITDVNSNNSELENTNKYDLKIILAGEMASEHDEEERKAVETMEKEREAVEMREKLSRDSFEKLMKENELDAMVTLGSDASSMLAIGGCPAITVPAGYESNGMPFGICFGGLKGSEPKLIEIAYAFEQATLIRRPPLSISLELGILTPFNH